MKYIHTRNLMNYVKLNRACQKEEKSHAPHRRRGKKKTPSKLIDVPIICLRGISLSIYINKGIWLVHQSDDNCFCVCWNEVSAEGHEHRSKNALFFPPFLKPIFKDFCLRRWSKDRRCSSLLISQYTVLKLLFKMCEAVNSELSTVRCHNHEKVALWEFSRILTSSFFSLAVCECCQ